MWTVLDLLDPTRVFQAMDAHYYYKLLLESYPAKTSRSIDVSQID